MDNNEGENPLHLFECGEDKQPESRLEIHRKITIERDRYFDDKARKKLQKLNSPFTRRFKNRERQRIWEGVPRNHRRYTHIPDYHIECSRFQKEVSDKFSPSNKLKDNTIKGPLDGKASWKTDYFPSVINTTSGEFCPATAADKDQINKENIVKTRKYEDKLRRGKPFGPGEELDLTFGWADSSYKYLYGSKYLFEEKKKIKKTGLPKLETETTFEGKLTDTIGGLDKESTSDRAAGFQALQAALCPRLVPDEVRNNYAIITEAVEKALRKGREAEQTTASKLIPILFVQLGEDQREPLLKLVTTPLLDIIVDKTVNASVRAECCQSLAMVSFLSSSTNNYILMVMKTYERILLGIYQQDGGFNKFAKAEYLLHALVLDSWSLLLSTCTPAEVHALLCRTTTTSFLSLSKLAQLLKAPSPELQKSAGIALSLVYELGSEFSERFGQDELATITADVERLTKESSRYKTKEHRKIQRGFSDVLKFFEDGVAPVETICVGDERVELDQWKLHVRYQRLAAALGSGLQVSTRTSLLRSALLLPCYAMSPLRNTDNEQKPDQNTTESKAQEDVLKAKKLLRFVLLMRTLQSTEKEQKYQHRKLNKTESKFQEDVLKAKQVLHSALPMGPLRSIDKEQKHQKPDQNTSESKVQGDILKAKKPPRNTAEKKARSISRAKLRDKRSAVLD